MIDHDVIIETEQLTEASAGLKAALEVVGDVPSIIEAQEKIGEALADMTDLEGFEDKLTAGVRHVERALELVLGYAEHAGQLYKAGLLRIGNEEWAHTTRLLVDIGDACNRWLDYAEHELRDIS